MPKAKTDGKRLWILWVGLLVVASLILTVSIVVSWWLRRGVLRDSGGVIAPPAAVSHESIAPLVTTGDRTIYYVGSKHVAGVGVDSICIVPAEQFLGTAVKSEAPRVLTSHIGCVAPVWNRAGDKIAYIDQTNKLGSEIVVADLLLGKRVRYLIKRGYLDASLSWDAAGEQIAYYDQTSSLVCVLNLSSGGTSVICKLPKAHDVSLSPDARWISCWTRGIRNPNDPSEWRVQVIDVRARSVFRTGDLGPGVAPKGPFCWTSDSQTLFFNSMAYDPGPRRLLDLSALHITSGKIERPVDLDYSDVLVQYCRFWTWTGELSHLTRN